MRVHLVIRAVTLAAMAACVLAVAVARTAPRPARFRVHAPSHRVIVPGLFFQQGRGQSHVLDTETGALTPLVLAEGDALEWASVSDWADDDGEHQVVGRWVHRESGRRNRALMDIGLGRFSFPGGRPLDRIPLPVLPASAPCWYPAGGERALFTTCDGQLYGVSLAGERGAATELTPNAVRPIRWPDPPPSLGSFRIQNPVWIKHPHLGDRFVVEIGAVSTAAQDAPDRSSRRWLCQRLWWLRLDPDGTRIVDGGPLLSDGEPDDQHHDLPSLAALPDGSLVLAYRRREPVLETTQLYLTRVEVDPRTGAPTARRADSAKVMDECAIFPAAFSPDGVWLYALQRESRGDSELRRLAVASVLPPSRTPRTCAPPAVPCKAAGAP